MVIINRLMSGRGSRWGLVALLFFLVAVLAVAGGMATGGFRGPSRTTELTEANNGEAVSLTPGERLQVVLNSNPTTGYEWQVESVDTNVLRITNAGDWTPDSDAEGSGGLYRIQFEAIGPGQTTVELVNRFGDEEPTERFQVTVTVSR